MASVSASAKYKVVFLGDQSVGKSRIITRFLYDKFDNSYQPTIGIDFFTKTMHHEDRKVTLEILDISGQEKFNRYMLGYVHNASVAVIIYDVASKESFFNTSKWMEEVRTKRGSGVIVVLVGNKTDLVNKRQVSIEEGEAKAQELALFTKIAAVLPETPRKQEDMDKDAYDRMFIYFGPYSIYQNQPKL